MHQVWNFQHAEKIFIFWWNHRRMWKEWKDDGRWCMKNPTYLTYPNLNITQQQKFIYNPPKHPKIIHNNPLSHGGTWIPSLRTRPWKSFQRAHRPKHSLSPDLTIWLYEAIWYMRDPPWTFRENQLEPVCSVRISHLAVFPLYNGWYHMKSHAIVQRVGHFSVFHDVLSKATEGFFNTLPKSSVSCIACIRLFRVAKMLVQRCKNACSASLCRLFSDASACAALPAIAQRFRVARHTWLDSPQGAHACGPPTVSNLHDVDIFACLSTHYMKRKGFMSRPLEGNMCC